MRRYLQASFASLVVRNYRLYFIGQAISVMGTWMQQLALAWLVLEITNSGTWLGVVVAATQLPTLLFGTLSGVLADRHSERTILLWASAVATLPPLTLAILALTHRVSVVLVLVIAFVGGCVDCIEKPARQSFPSELVHTEVLSNAIVLNNVIQDIGKAVGPALGALFLATVGVPATFLMNSASFIAVFVGLALMRPLELQPRPEVVRRRGELRAGLSYVWRTPRLLGPIALLFAAGLMAYNFQVLLPLTARQTFHGGARQAGYLLAALGIGAVVAGVSVAGIIRPTPRKIVAFAVLMAALFLVMGAAPTFLSAFVIVLCIGASSVLYKTMSNSWLQLTSNAAMRGRVMSLLVIAIAGTSPIGAPLVGWLATEFSARTAFMIAGLGTIVASLVAYVYLSRKRVIDSRAMGRLNRLDSVEKV